MRNALAGNLIPSLTACNTRPRWPCIRWLISALLLLVFCPQALIWELVCWCPLGYWPPITVLGDLSPDLSAAWSVGGHLVTDPPDHRSWRSPPWSLCHLVHVSPCEWSTWFSAADVIDYRWPIGSVPISTQTWLKNDRDNFFIPLNGFHHLRGLFPKHIIIPKQNFPTWFVYRTNFYELPLFTNAKSCLPFYSTFNCKNKLTLLYAGIQNSWTNSVQLEEYDGDHIGEAFINEGRGYSPTHLKFFLLVFSNIKEELK